jgi:hypothetical protein
MKAQLGLDDEVNGHSANALRVAKAGNDNGVVRG